MSIIVESAINFPPYFDPPLDDIFPAQMQLSYNSGSWSLDLPSVIDPEGKAVDVIADLGSASDFMEFSQSELTLSVDDLSDSGIESGFYEIIFKLIDDRDNEVEEIVIIDVRDPDPDEVIIASTVEEEDTEEAI